jgi:ubiquinone/menaquinone biosynthesis C-methylase UbiE
LLDSELRQNNLVLDAGCGSGELSVYAKNLDGNVVSLDISKSYLKRVRSLVDARICASSDLLPFRPNFFDIVICADVIEHIPAYDKVISELHRVSKGLVVITTPCEGVFRGIWGFLFPKKLASIDRTVGHFHIFPISKLKQKFLKFDSSTITCRSYHVLQPFADKFLSKNAVVLVDLFERFANLVLPNHGTISLVIMTRK